MRIYVDLASDRDSIQVAFTFMIILAKNSYTVCQGREKQGNKYVRYVEYWKEGEQGDRNARTDRPD